MSAIDPLKPTVPAAPAKAPGAPAASATPQAPASAPAAYAADSAQLTVPQALDLAGLTAEEAAFVQEGFLPADFAALRVAQKVGGVEAAVALARQGVKGPFEKSYGNPDAMLAGARRWAKNPELARLVKEVKPGDLIATTWRNPDDLIQNATKGPFHHILICVKAGPPAEFVEALGDLTDVKDVGNNKVLRSQMASQGYNGQTFRLLRPTEGLAPHEADKAIARAIAFAENQLGKPYDYTFTNTNGRGVNDAFYCSELGYKAYADPAGADLAIPLRKSALRDKGTAALARILDELGATDTNALAYDLLDVQGKQPVDEGALVKVLAEKVLPRLEATRGLAVTPEREAALELMLGKLVKGDVFHRLAAELTAFDAEARSGAHQGLGGFFKRAGAAIGIGWAGLRDARELTRGVGFFRSLGATWKLFKAITPHAETLTSAFFGPEDPRAKKAKAALDTLDGLARDARRVPLVGKLWPLPERPRPELNQDFVSPTDLAWSGMAHQDFNVKPDFPVDQAQAEKVWR